MRQTVLTAAIFATLAAPAFAAENVELAIRYKGMAATAAQAAPARNAEAPFRVARDPIPELFAREEEQRKGLRGACENNTAALCYDMVDRRVVYRPARKYMPQFEGLRAESVSLRQDRLILKYSFR